MLKPLQIITRKIDDRHTVWIPQDHVEEVCSVSFGYLAKVRSIYKNSLPPSWRRSAEKEDFFLPDNGHSWRWGRKNGIFYYDLDRIPDRSPTRYRQKFREKKHYLESTFRNSWDSEPSLVQCVEELIDRNEINYFSEYRIGNRNIFNETKSIQLARSCAWCRFIIIHSCERKFEEFGCKTRETFLRKCLEKIITQRNEGLRIKTLQSLKKKISQCPKDFSAIPAFLISGKYGNHNSRKLGGESILNTETGELFDLDIHQATIMTYWLNPGATAKRSKKEAWEMYCRDMENKNIPPVSLSTFRNYTNSWYSQLLSSRERHGKKYTSDNYRPFVPARPLEYANSLWAADGSGIIPYRYRDRKGTWKIRKLYAIFVTDIASKFIAGFSVSRPGRHDEDPKMVKEALKMALLINGKSRICEFISDNHGAFTSSDSKNYLRLAANRVRTIRPGNSQANPAETIFRLFKQKFKTELNILQTSWNAKGRDSVANTDYFDPEELPSYEQAVVRLRNAIEVWNGTASGDGITPKEWFLNNKNPKAGTYTEREFRRLTGNLTTRDISLSRGVLTVEKNGINYKFDIPFDEESLLAVSANIKYSPRFKTNIYWDSHGADIYTLSGNYILSCLPAPEASKSISESDEQSSRALTYYLGKADNFDRILDESYDKIERARDTIMSDYGIYVSHSRTKETHNTIMENARMDSTCIKVRPTARLKSIANLKNESKPDGVHSVNFHRNRISDISKYM